MRGSHCGILPIRRCQPENGAAGRSCNGETTNISLDSPAGRLFYQGYQGNRIPIGAVPAMGRMEGCMPSRRTAHGRHGLRPPAGMAVMSWDWAGTATARTQAWWSRPNYFTATQVAAPPATAVRARKRGRRRESAGMGAVRCQHVCQPGSQERCQTRGHNGDSVVSPRSRDPAMALTCRGTGPRTKRDCDVISRCNRLHFMSI